MAEEQDQVRAESGARGGLAAVGIAAFAIGCCASAPLLVGLAGGIAATTLVGAGATLLASLMLMAVLVLVVRRRRRACDARASAHVSIRDRARGRLGMARHDRRVQVTGNARGGSR